MIIDLWVDVNAIGSFLSWVVGIIIVIGMGLIFGGIAAALTDEDIPGGIGLVIGLIVGGYAFYSWKSWLDWFFSGFTSITFSILEIIVVAVITNIIISIYIFFKVRRDEKNMNMPFDY